MPRHVHYLRGNKRCETPHAAIWFDTETHQDPIDDSSVSHRLWFGYAHYARTLRNGEWSAGHWCRFTTLDGFYDFIDAHIRPKVTLYCFCHNTNFDLPVLDVFNLLPQRGWTLATAIIDAPPTIIKFRRAGNQLVFLDTLNWWRCSLDQLGQMVRMPKLPMPSKDAPAAVWDRYGKRDVEVLREACVQWWQFLVKEDLGGFANTLASQAFRTYRHRFMDVPILIDNNEEANHISRQAYVGGRTECLYIGKINEHVSVLDVHSMYPSVMRQGQYPTELRGWWRNVDIDELRATVESSCVCAEVDIETDEPVYPYHAHNRLYFPVGRFTTYLSTPELKYALDHGHILQVRQAAVYERAQIFAPFVEYMYRERHRNNKAGNDTRAWQFKILMNSLYGKFGQRGLVFEEIERTDDLSGKAWSEFDHESGKTYHYRQLAGLVQCQSEADESRESMPAIAAHVTAEARMKLWGLRCQAGHDNVFYMDTDCLWVNDAGRCALQDYIHPYRLGSLGVEYEAESAVIHTLKDYGIGEKSRHKGIKANAEWIDANTARQEQWSSLRGQLRRGQLGQATTKQVTKHLQRRYLKGVVQPCGRVRPFVLPDESDLMCELTKA